jgi:hypothetical protein
LGDCGGHVAVVPTAARIFQISSAEKGQGESDVVTLH